jgi:uncharacterized membrane protein (UPF0127 family)
MRLSARFGILIQLICTLIFLIGCNNTQLSIRKDGKLFFLKNDDSVITSIDIEIAETPESRRAGLMYRELSDFTSGMLFVFQDVKPRNFWMRNTPTPLDIIFIGEDSRVINIASNTTPMSDNRYNSRNPAKYVLEVKGGFCKRYGIKTGNKISCERL